MVHEKEIEIRWRDLDSFDHVNHVVFLTYLEEARDEWLGRVLEDPALVWGYVIARVEIDYRRELSARGRRRRRARARSSGSGRRASSRASRSSPATARSAAEAKAVLVARDRKTGQSRVISDDERAAFERAVQA